MGHWFTRWFVFTYGVHVVAQVTTAQAALWLFGYDVSDWLRYNRPLIALVLCLHFVCYFIAKLASLERDHLDEVARERLRDD